MHFMSLRKILITNMLGEDQHVKKSTAIISYLAQGLLHPTFNPSTNTVRSTSTMYPESDYL